MNEKERKEVEAFTLELYSVSQVAAILNVSNRTIMNYIKQGRIKGAKIGGKWKFTREAIEKFAKGE